MADLYSLLKQFNTIGGMVEIGQSGFCLLMALWQKSNELNWASQFSMTNTELMFRSGYNSEKSMIDKRLKMSQQGYFKYTSPTNRKYCGTYTINFDLVDYFLKHSSRNSSKHSINVSSEVHSEVHSEVSSELHINKLNQTKQNNITPIGVVPHRINYQEIVDMYNSICVSLPKVKSLTDSRKDKIKVRYKQLGSIDKFEEVFVIVESSDFLKGNNKNNWKASFDWLMENDKNMAKVLEGNYNKDTVDKSGDGYSYNAFDEYNLKG